MKKKICITELQKFKTTLQINYTSITFFFFGKQLLSMFMYTKQKCHYVASTSQVKCFLKGCSILRAAKYPISSRRWQGWTSTLGISELKWTGMDRFNSDDHCIYYCGQESLRRNGVALIVNKRVWNVVLGCNLKNNRMISVHFQDKPFNITVNQVHAQTTDAKEAKVEWFYEELQHLLELTSKKTSFSSQEIRTMCRKWWPKPPPSKRQARRQSSCLRRPYK